MKSRTTITNEFITDDLEDEASKRNWKVVENNLYRAYLLRITPKYDFKCNVDCHERHGILHSMLKYNPPIHVVRKIIHYFPDSVVERTCTHHLPLHTALAYGTSERVIREIMHLDEIAASSVDIDGKTCFHLALDGYEIISIDLSTRLMCDENMTEVLTLLYEAAPSSIVKMDNNYKNIIGYAVEKRVSSNVLEHLKQLYSDFDEIKTQDSQKCKCEGSLSPQSQRSRRNSIMSFISAKENTPTRGKKTKLQKSISERGTASTLQKQSGKKIERRGVFERKPSRRVQLTFGTGQSQANLK